eukprot:1158422-Pelagomonas_calceolata.AAC.2
MQDDRKWMMRLRGVQEICKWLIRPRGMQEDYYSGLQSIQEQGGIISACTTHTLLLPTEPVIVQTKLTPNQSLYDPKDPDLVDAALMMQVRAEAAYLLFLALPLMAQYGWKFCH